MTQDEIRTAVLRVLSQIALEAEPTRLRDDINLRDQLDIDSMDFLNFLIGLHKEFHVNIPESDYPKLTRLNDCVKYLSGKFS